MTVMGTITSKLQVTIPKAIAEAVGLMPNTHVVFTAREDGRIELQSARSSAEEIAGSLIPKVGKKVSES